MLKKILYNKYILENIPVNMPYSSEEFFKILYDKKDCIFFKHDKEFRLLPYSGNTQDFLGRSTKFQPTAIAGSETYKMLDKKDCEIYHENSLSNNFSQYSFITEDIDNYINVLSSLDNAIIQNTKQIYIPFIVKSSNKDTVIALKKFFSELFGTEFKALINEIKIKDGEAGTTIETTNMQLFTQQLQDTKKKILDEAFLYLGVSSPVGKLAHQSELEVAEASKVTDVLDNVMLRKFIDFIERVNKHFGTDLKIVKNI